MSIILQGSTSGSVTLQEPAVAGTTVLDLPSTSGTVVLQNASNNLLMNSGYGSNAVAYGCRAWVNFDGTTNTGGFCTIRGSGNVTSVADNGGGDYTVNFTNALPDANYALAYMLKSSATIRFESAVIRGDTSPTTTSVRFVTGLSTYGVENYPQDSSIICISIFR